MTGHFADVICVETTFNIVKSQTSEIVNLCFTWPNEK